MYTSIRSYQILISLLKKYNIRHLVLSAGSRNVPFVHSVEKDDFFTCYSVVDERSAGYFAMGLSQELGEPVAISCTSATATCNYYPAVTEAFYQNVPLVVITSDRNPAFLGQREDQMIDQVGMYDRFCKKSVTLPIVKSREDEWFCGRLVNEALLELDHHGKGPVHINAPTENYNLDFSVKSLPKTVKIDRFSPQSADSDWKMMSDRLRTAKRILVVSGENSQVPDGLNRAIDSFSEKYNCAVSVEYMANLSCSLALNTFFKFDRAVTSLGTFEEEFLPEIVISFGGNIMSGLKLRLRDLYGRFENWSVSEDGKVLDMFKGLTDIFECSPEYFFARMASLATDGTNDMQYYDKLKAYTEDRHDPVLPFCNVTAIKQMIEKIPPRSNLHMSINNAIRLSHFAHLGSGVKAYANIGTYGIDGCMSTMLGQAAASPEKLNFLCVGDLSFFYDMNALKIRHVGSNVRIMMVNNNGGGEFYYHIREFDDTIDRHTSARHKTSAEGWVKSNNFEYLSASNSSELALALERFLSPNGDRPVFLEVFTEMSSDTDYANSVFTANNVTTGREKSSAGFRRVIKKIVGQGGANKLKKFLK